MKATARKTLTRSVSEGRSHEKPQYNASSPCALLQNYTNIDTSRIAHLAFSVESQLLEFRVALAYVDTTESSGAISSVELEPFGGVHVRVVL